MSQFFRRHRRVPARIPVRICAPDGAWSAEVVSRDVSLSGVFVLTETIPASAHRVRVECVLPDRLDRISMRGRVVRREEGRGAGLELLCAYSAADMERWSEFIAITQAHHAAQDPACAQSRERTGVFVEHALRFETLDELEALQEIDLYMGGIFLKTTAPVGVGERMGLTVVHPVDGSRFLMPVQVTRKVITGAHGVCVAFVGDVARLSAALREFISAGLPELDLSSPPPLWQSAPTTPRVRAPRISSQCLDPSPTTAKLVSARAPGMGPTATFISP